MTLPISKYCFTELLYTSELGVRVEGQLKLTKIGVFKEVEPVSEPKKPKILKSETDDFDDEDLYEDGPGPQKPYGKDVKIPGNIEENKGDFEESVIN